MRAETPGINQEEIRDCVFCREFFPNKDPVLENELASAYYDEHPLSDGHLLIIPKGHVEDFFAMSDEQRQAVDALIVEAKNLLDKSDPKPDGYNIGVNAGEAAGQTVKHHHTHLIPRYNGDVEDPRGGIRHMMPDGMSNYQPPE